MITKRIELVEVEITTWKCDFCEISTEHNTGCCGSTPIMTCNICRKHMCHKHRHYYQEDGASDYFDVIVCPVCNPKFKEAWEWAQDNAGRHDSIYEVSMNRFSTL